MSEADQTYAALNGYRCTAVNMTVGNSGPWIADCDMESDQALAGRVVLRIGELAASGTVDARAAGTHGAQRKVRVIGGAGGWGTVIGAKSYANDAGVKARTVAEDAARAIGEKLGTFVPQAEKVGRAYVRDAGPASRTLEDVAGDVAWWVDLAGVTHVGPRSAVELPASAYQVLAYDPRDRIVTLAVDDASAVTVGSVLTERLDAPQTVRSLEVRVSAGELRIVAWCGGSETGAAQLAGLLRSIAQRSTDGKLFGAYRYRVIRMAGERVELQAVRRAAGLPDLLPVSVWPGIAGAVAELAPSAEVLVSFIEGDRTQPYVHAFAGADGVGFVPSRLTLGGDAGSNAARVGDNVEVLLPPAIFNGTISGAPATGVLAFPLVKTLGVITAGSGKVRIA